MEAQWSCYFMDSLSFGTHRGTKLSHSHSRPSKDGADLRGYGNTDAPNSISNHTSLSIVGDLVAIINALGHDWGAFHAWYVCILRPDRVKALINLGVASVPPPRNPSKEPTQSL
ncbi:hypothetical protein Syun_008542 [Stephania yunnanensis]|uniref:AB hydrolase-1 domain-containing protein n=1 Tax=Stephania yunnanensis TaxID=152371 RepID=A0AAP0PMN7_9MAGN